MITSILDFKPISSEIAIPLLMENRLPTQDLDDSTKLFGIFEGEELVGVAGLEFVGTLGLVRSVAISHSHQKRGMGSQLIRNLEEEAQKQGLSAWWLLTNTAERFFSRLGYEKVERHLAPIEIQQHPQFTGLCPSSAVVMTKSI